MLAVSLPHSSNAALPQGSPAACKHSVTPVTLLFIRISEQLRPQ